MVGRWGKVWLTSVPWTWCLNQRKAIIPCSLWFRSIFSIVAAALRACRRVNDFSLTTRILEVVRIKCGNREAEIWPYMMQVGSSCSEVVKQGWNSLQELAPVMKELGISSPADMGYDKPELALPNPYNIHWTCGWTEHQKFTVLLIVCG